MIKLILKAFKTSQSLQSAVMERMLVLTGEVSQLAKGIGVLSETLNAQAKAIDSLAVAIDEMTGLTAQVVQDQVDHNAEVADVAAAPTTLDD